MSIRFEREPMFCSHLKKDVIRLVEYSTPSDLAHDDELQWIKGSTECLKRKNCGTACPGEDSVLQKK